MKRKSPPSKGARASLTASSTPSKSLDELIRSTKAAIEENTPDRGMLPDDMTATKPFDKFPLSPFTINALKSSKFITATPIQNATLMHGLAGRDILGAAKTGSGKTLAFVVPLIEKLWRERWSTSDGLGAVVLSPTRELAVQIFEVIRLVGKNHSLSAGLITGGKKEFREEQSSVIQMNILVCTPGRLLQHLEQTPSFDASGVQVLVLDEADRILDLGFSSQLNSILDYLPNSRQTMLFSATQTKSVKQLARLSLNKPEYISVNEKDKETTPTQLVQNYIVCELPQKLDVLFSFIKSHLKKKTVVFFSSCAQVRFVNEVMCGLQPGVPLLALHGKIKQEKRTSIYFDFLRKPSAVLFATDVAARGLDFPAVDWVVQMDCPEDSDMYIHRVGRTARNNSAGKGLLCLLPSEQEAASKMLADANIPVTRLSVNPAKTVTVSKRAASVVASNVVINGLAKKAFKSYLKSVHMMPNKDIFKIDKLDFAEFAKSLGLATAPSVRFLRDIIKGGEEAREENREKKNKSRKLEKLKRMIREEKLKKRIEAGSAKKASAEDEGSSDSEDEMADFLKVKQSHKWGEGEEGAGDGDKDFNIIMEREVKESRKQKKQRFDGTATIREDGTAKGTLMSKKTTFDDDGNAIDDSVEFVSEKTDRSDLEQDQEEFVRSVKQRLDATKEADKSAERARLKEKRMKMKGEKVETSDPEDDQDGGSGSGSGSDSDSGSGSDSDSDSDDSDHGDDSDMDVEGMEAAALEMLNK